MAENQFGGVVESLLKGMDTILSTKTVVGEATKIGDTIILPLVDVTFGVGAGAGMNGEKKAQKGAGGIGGKMTPSAVLVIGKNGSARLVNIKNQDTVTKILDMIPDFLDKLSTKKDATIPDEAVVDIAFPEKAEE
ncbi:MAG: GerW family sporulation protein [Lachnospiraceae bacterium]|nr:GerW family sporulation protein [Lachnospiraceae bacterium]